ncbi:hypothetical protein QWJ34_15740 [Saccharibacillus sp. CPCC 101409]|uniref:hypothetical protein n=1 Tax=Saccharibacillus sp. CPCC 101409 TaxID=3058041 RepID=UPI0026723D87|nr:hypothetical protein [Saccharibacillus sp. CPCC 101409]MDO3411218.1 hypothetical protein [Saccharibacillus sp. CPCC 101409]
MGIKGEREEIRLPSHWGEAVHTLHGNGSDTLVVLLPGQNYSCARPVLHIARRAALEAGLDVLEIEYGYFGAHRALERDQVPVVMRESAEAVQKVQSGYKRIVLVGKSLGSIAVGEVSAALERSRGLDELRHLYLTPISLTLPHIERTGGTVVYGTEDPAFGPDETSRLADISGVSDVRTVRVEGANHGLETADLPGSIDILKRLAEVYTDFLEEAAGRD